MPSLAHFNLIGGKNDVGKSSLLEALFTFYDRANPAALFGHLGWRGIATVAVDPQSLWGPAFTGLDLSKQIRISAVDRNGTKTDLTFRVDNNHVAPTAFTPYNNGALNKGTLQNQSALSALAVRASRPDKVLQETFVSFGPQGFSAQGTISESISVQAVYLHLQGRLNDTNAPMRLTQLDSINRKDEAVAFAKLIDERVQDLSVGVTQTNSPYIAVTAEGMARKVPLGYLGSGVAVAVSIGLAILNSPNGTVLIDELEVGIHHTSLKKFIKTLSDVAFEKKCQIFATTHSYECINAAFSVFKDQDERRFSYSRLERNKQSKVIAKTYPKDTLAYALESEWEVR